MKRKRCGEFEVLRAQAGLSGGWMGGCFLSRVARLLFWGVAVGLLWAGGPAEAQERAGARGPAEEGSSANAALVQRAVGHLSRRALQGRHRVGESALVALALMKAGQAADHPAVARMLANLEARLAGGAYNPDRVGGPDNYEAGLVSMALVTAERPRYRAQIEAVGRYLLAKQLPAGSWDYANRNFGDTSMTQFALLGLWEASNAGFDVPANVWDRAAEFLLRTQHDTGGFYYHADAPDQLKHTMTAGGLSGLFVCRDKLRLRRPGAQAALVPVGEAPRTAYQAKASGTAIGDAIQRATNWLAQNFTVSQPVGPRYYYLYGLERVGALSRSEQIGGHNWYTEGSAFLASSQGADGAWRSDYEDVVDTSFALLFLTRSTGQSVRKWSPIAGFGAGTLLGGRGLPSELSQATVRQGRLVASPLEAPIEELLRILERPDSGKLSSAAAGVEQTVRQKSATSLAGQEARLEKLAQDPRPEVRRTALFGLARTGRYEVAPILIEALRDGDAACAREARKGLSVLSRKPDGVGLPEELDAKQLDEEVKRWQAWYRAVRAYDELGDP